MSVRSNFEGVVSVFPDVIMNDIQQAVESCEKTIIVHGIEVSISKTIKVVASQPVCVECGMDLHHFTVANSNGVMILLAFGLNENKPVLLTKDHIIPRSIGGSDSYLNLQTMCSHCNGSKSDAQVCDYKKLYALSSLISEIRERIGNDEALIRVIGNEIGRRAELESVIEPNFLMYDEVDDFMTKLNIQLRADELPYKLVPHWVNNTTAVA